MRTTERDPRTSWRPRLWIGGLAGVLAFGTLLIALSGSSRGDGPVGPVVRAEPEVDAAPDAESPATSAPRAELVDPGQLLALELAELASRDPEACLARLRQLLGGSDDERLAAVEHIRSAGIRDPVTLLAAAITDPGSSAGVQSAALVALEPFAAQDRRARTALLEFLLTGPPIASERSMAFRAVLRPGIREEFDRCLPLVLEETEPDVVVNAAQAIAGNIDPAIRNKANSLHWRHPDPEVRQRLRGVRLGR